MVVREFTTTCARAICAALVLVLLAAWASPGRADVSWDFIVTSAVNLSCPGCALFPVPATGGSLTVSDAAFLRGSVSYSYNVDIDLNDPSLFDGHVTGDTDFSLTVGAFGLLPLPAGVGFSVGQWGNHASVNLSFSQNGTLNGSIAGDTNFDNIIMSIMGGAVIDAFMASDLAVPGCGDFAACRVNGYWQLASTLPMPEPSSLGILLAAISVLGMLGGVRPRASHPSRIAALPHSSAR